MKKQFPVDYNQPHISIMININTFLVNNGIPTSGQNWVKSFAYIMRAKTIFREELEKNGDSDKDLRFNHISVDRQQLIKQQISIEFVDNLSIQLFRSVPNILSPSLNIFENFKGILWEDIRITKADSQIIYQLINFQYNLAIFFQHLINVIRGDFQYTERMYFNKICFCEGFYLKNKRIQSMLSFMVWPKRVPIIKDKMLKGFKVIQYMEIKYQKNSKKAQKDISSIKDNILIRMQELKNDHDRYKSFLPEYVLTEIPADKRKKFAFQKITAIVNCIDDPDFDYYIYGPKIFPSQYIQESFVLNYKQNQNDVWEYLEEFDHIKDKFKMVDDDLADKVQEEKGAQQILKLIKSIPQLKFQLTFEQEKMISTPNNLLCLGRSGTGKTTSSALRLFSTDAFYKYIEEFKKFQNEKKQQPIESVPQKFKISPYFMNNPSNLRLVFVTASPVLTNEVKKFYNDMKQHLIQQIINHRKKQEEKKKQKVNENKEEYKIGSDNEEDLIEVIDESIQDKSQISSDLNTTQTLGINNNDLNDYLTIEKDVIEEEEELEKQLNLPSSIDHLTNDHFPLFATIKRFINMIDASLDFSFFSRNFEGKIIGMESNVEWHNESKGVFMINQYFKQKDSYDEKIKRLGKQLINIDEKLESQNLDEIKFDDEQVVYEDENDLTINVSEGLRSFISEPIDRIFQQSTIVNRQLSFEIDFDIFKTRFWPKVTQTTKLAALVVWQEIYSVIKGGSNSYQYNECILPFFAYVGVNSQRKERTNDTGQNNFLLYIERVQIYYIFYQYEQWKNEINAYDFMDVVNHILTQTRVGLYKQSQRIQFLMVDEVQDLTPNILRLLMKMTDRNIFFCGDTAQTIAKGVGFRFYDMKKIFSNKNIQVPYVLQLAKNFRSHSKILNLANSVISLIELFFPKTIDKLQKESSELDGPKPIIIDPAQKDQQLKELLFSRAFSNQTLSQNINESSINQDNNASMDRPQFGCNQVVIVRDQESKARVPEFLQNMLCLTVYEAKGLEFDDVILINFFEDSKCGSQWKLLQDVEYSIKTVKKLKEFKFIDFENLDIIVDDDDFEIDQQNNDNIPTLRKTNSKQPYDKIEDIDDEPNQIKTVVQQESEEIETSLKLKRQRGEIYRKFAQLCTELKFLYVGITRPKKVLIIYDTDNRYRKPLQDFWNAQGLIEVITKEMIANPSLLKPEIQTLLKYELQSNSQGTSKQDWLGQGIMLFKKKFYLSAMQCFKNASENDLYTRCLAYMHADKAAALQGESEQRLMQSKQKAFKVSERNQYKKESADMKKESSKQMEIAGGYFEQIKMFKHAAQCYCSSKNLEKAALMFESQKEYGQSAECFLKSGNLKKAAEWYGKAKLFANAFECYERLQDWEGLLICLSKNKDFFKKEERESLVEKYFPIALNQLYQLYSNMDPMAQGLSEDNKGKLQEMKIKLKFQKSVSIIKEDENEDEEDIEEELEQEKEQEQTQDHQSIIQQEQEESKNNQVNNNDDEIIQIDTSSKKKNETEQTKILSLNDISQDDLQSFEIIDEKQDNLFTNADSKKSNANQEYNEQQIQEKLDFEILSNLDPDDEFLQSQRSHSIIHSLINSEKDQDDQSIIGKGSCASEFSIIQNSKIHSIIKSVYSQALSLAPSLKSEEASIDLPSQILNDLGENNSQISGGSALFSNTGKFSTIDNDRDIYIEDIVMQKIIFYISLFSEDVKERLQEMRSKDSLGHLQSNNDPYDQFMIIDLDNISQEILYLILDTLEHYELFRLCFIICNRYSLKERIGRYLVSIGNKYSNLKFFRFIKSFNLSQETTNIRLEMQAQQKYSIIANEAMHNVLGMIEQTYLQINDQGHDIIGFRKQCFESLFLQGFWKKLVFLMDVDSSIELASALDDHESFKLLYLVYKQGIKDGKLIGHLLQPNNYVEFSDYINKHSSCLKDKILAQEIIIQQEALKFKQDVLALKKIKEQTELIKYVKKQTVINIKMSLETQQENHNYQEEQKGKKSQKYKAVRRVSEDYSYKLEFQQIKSIAAYIFELVALTSQYKQIHQNIGLMYTYKELQQLNANLWFLYKESAKCSSKIQNNSKQTKGFLKKIQYELKRVIYKCFGITPLEDYEIFNKFNNKFAIMKSDSILFQSIQSKQDNQIKQFKNERLHCISLESQSQYFNHNQFYNHVINSYTKEMNDIEGSKQILSSDLACCCDLNFKYFMVPSQWIDDIILSFMANFSRSILNFSFIRQLHSLDIITNHLGNINSLYQMTALDSKHIYEREKNMQDKYIYYQQVIRAPLQKLIQQPIEDSSCNRLKGVQQQAKEELYLIKQNFIDCNVHMFASDQSIQLPPFDKSRQQPMSKQIKSQVLQMCFSSAKLAMKFLKTSQKQYYTQILQAFKGFSFSDDYIYLLEIIRAQRKLIKVKQNAEKNNPIIKNLPQKTKQRELSSANQDKLLKDSLTLLDAHVYLKCNSWVSAADSIFIFINSAIQNLEYIQIVELIEAAFYRIMFNYYIYKVKPDQGVTIPNYAMIHLEPHSKYDWTIVNGNQNLLNVKNIEYHKIYLQPVKDMKLITEAFYWCQILIEALNKSEDSIPCEQIYCRVYNMIITLFLNTNYAELFKEEKLCEHISQLAIDIQAGPFDSYFKECDFMTEKKSIPNQVQWAKNRNIQKLYALLKFEKEDYETNYTQMRKKIGINNNFFFNQNAGFVRLFCTSKVTGEFEKQSKMFQKIMERAYFNEESQLAKHISASNYIKKIFNAKKLKIQKIKEENKQQVDISQTIQVDIHFQFIYALQDKFEHHLNAFNLIKICSDTNQKYNVMLRQYINLMQSKLVVNSFDLHHVLQKFDLMNSQISQYLNEVKSITFSVDYSIEDKINKIKEFSEQKVNQIKDEQKDFEQWLNLKAEQSLIEIEKKNLNMRSKWENLIQFQKKKKIMLRHLQQKRKLNL